MHAEQQHERAADCDPARRDARQHDNQAAEQGADRRNEGQQSGLDAEDERAGDTDHQKAEPGHHEYHRHGNHLCDQPALQRRTDAVDDGLHLRTDRLRRHGNEALAVDSRLCGEGKPEKQHDEEVSDRADGAEDELQRLADDRTAARCERARARQVVLHVGQGCRACRRCGGAGRVRRNGIEIEIARIDAVRLEERLEIHDLRFDRAAQCGRLLGDGGAAEREDTGHHRREQQADQEEARRMRPRHHLLELVRHRGQRHAEQHAGEDQEQGRGEFPGEDQERGEADGQNAADGDGPGEILTLVFPFG